MTTELATWRELADTTDLRWPEWEDDGRRYRLGKSRNYNMWPVEVAKGVEPGDEMWCPDHYITGQEAEWAFERHADRWLWEKHGIHLGRLQGKVLVGTKTGILCTDGKIKNWLPLEHESVAQFDEPGAALQAAVRAVAKEGKESPCKQ